MKEKEDKVINEKILKEEDYIKIIDNAIQYYEKKIEIQQKSLATITIPVAIFAIGLLFALPSPASSAQPVNTLKLFFFYYWGPFTTVVLGLIIILIIWLKDKQIKTVYSKIVSLYVMKQLVIKTGTLSKYHFNKLCSLLERSLLSEVSKEEQKRVFEGASEVKK